MFNKKEDDKPIYTQDNTYGFWKQQNPKHFDYTVEYKNKQSTTESMCWLRLGFLASCLPPLIFNQLNVCDVGSGNDTFVHKFKHLFKYLCGYDLSGESISKEFLYGNLWDVIFLTDVLEHFENIEDLFNIHWRYLFLSFPETPTDCISQQQLEQWKHYKPNEHIWCLNTPGMIKWFEDHNCEVVRLSDLEDLIRTPQKDNIVNITTMVVKNNKYV